MGKKIEKQISKTLPSSPTHSFSSSSSSSSDFEFRISISPRKSSAALCPADELFYKGQILPLHLSPRISMVRTLLLASSSTSSSSDTTTTASRDSSSSNDSTSSSFASDLSLLAVGDPCCDSSRPSSATEDDNHHHNNNNNNPDNLIKRFTKRSNTSSSSKYFSLSRFSSVFKKDSVNNTSTTPKDHQNGPLNNNSNVKKMSSSAKDMVRKYLKKVKPLYEKLSSKQQLGRSTCVGGGPVLETVGPARTTSSGVLLRGPERSIGGPIDGVSGSVSQSFSGNLKCSKLMKRRYVASCPSSMRSSPSHSGVLTRAGLPAGRAGSSVASTSSSTPYGSSCSSYSSESSTMEELQNAIQGAIAHCKNSMLQSSSSSFNNSNINNKKCKAFEI